MSADARAGHDAVSLKPREWSRRRFALAVFAAFAIPALVSSAQQYYSSISEGQTIAFARVMTSQTTFWLTWCALAPFIAITSTWVTRVLRGVLPRLVVLTLVGVVCAALHSVVVAAVRAYSTPSETRSHAHLLIAFFEGWLVINLVLYAAIVSAVFALGNYHRYRDRELVASRLAVQLSQAQLLALRMQLHPHFLFNALNTIAMLVRRGDEGAAVRTIASLSDILRHVLEDDAADEVPLRDELSFIERYLEIERTRFQHRLQVSVSVGAEVMDALVPNLILQPLVENAIRHGISARAAGGELAISATRSGQQLVMVVRDDGPGFSPSGALERVGLRNTRERLAQLYEHEGSVSCTNSDASGALVTVAIPWHTNPRTAT